jgi:exopolysaccharide biosynthesis protein
MVMSWGKHLARLRRERPGRRRFIPGSSGNARWIAGVLGVAILAMASGAMHGAEDKRNRRAVAYVNEKVPEGPWSVHLVKIDRANPEYEVHSMLAKDAVSGMNTLSEQVKALSPELGRPIAAINGDFYFSSPKAYYGDPQGLQILRGELVSGPTDHACLWIDSGGRPLTGVVQSLFRARWMDDTTTPFGLNEDRPEDGAVLYTPTMGAATGTEPGGREFVLEAVEKESWLPLCVGAKLRARVREIREDGNTPLKPGILVLSIGPHMLVDAPVVTVGEEVVLSTATVPDLTGARMAIGGGPRLVFEGKQVNGWKSPNQRHPRTAIGWNDDYLYFMLVDGRRPGVSVGMSFQEMADYFLKLGCTYAVNLDGGGSASMWAFGHVVSQPSQGQERPIANGLVLIKKPKAEPDGAEAVKD